MSEHQTFRANVGVVVVGDGGRVLALERSGRAGAWQLPQGGLRRGEEPLEAALRELCEETGLRAEQVELVDEHPRWLAYELPAAARSPKTGRGQVQKWFLFRLTDGSAVVALGEAGRPEFGAAKWMSLHELAEQTWEVRRPVYRELVARFAAHLDR